MARTNAPYAEPYWLDLSAKATGSFILLAPAFAALSAWDAARWRGLALVPVRGWTQLLARHLLIVGLITTVTFAVTLAALAGQITPSTGFPRVDVLLVGVLMVIAYASAGFVLGRLLPRMIAPPVAFAVVWFWVAYTPAIQPFWLRNVNGNLAASCCSLSAELVDKALIAPAVIGCALIVASLLIVRRPTAAWSWSFATGGVVVAVVVASGWMSNVGADPVQARRSDQKCLGRGDTVLCAWPEHVSKLRTGSEQLSRTVSHLRSVGLKVPRRLEESSSTNGDGWSFSLSAPTAGTWTETLATSPLNSLPPECIEDNGGFWPAGENQALLTSWLVSVAGVAPPDDAAADAGADVTELRRLLAQSPSRQSAWYQKTLRAMSDCDPVQ